LLNVGFEKGTADNLFLSQADELRILCRQN
jgi:hypothetical protein